MTFLNPLMLWGSLAAVVPVLLHLWGRRRPTTVRFPTLRFIRAGMAQQRSLSRLRQWLLLALRVLMVLLLALALAHPVARAPWLSRWVPAERDLCLVVDTSASMTARHRGRSAFTVAAEVARRIAARAPRSLRLHVYAAGATVREADMADLQPSAARGQLLQALSASQEAVLRAPQTRLALVTDLQETSLQGTLPWAPCLAPLVVDVGSPGARNAGLTSATSRSLCPLAGRPSTWQVSAAAWGLEPPARLAISALEGSRALPGATLTFREGQASGALRYVPGAGGDRLLRFSVPADGYALDDALWAVDHVRATLRVLAITGPSSPRFLATALAPAPAAPVRTTVIHWSSLPASLPAADLLVLADLPPAMPAAVTAALHAGLHALVFCGPGALLSAAVSQDLLGAPLGLGAPQALPADALARLGWYDTSYPALAPFASPLAGDLGEFRFRIRRKAAAPMAGRVIARFDDGTPALVASTLPDRPGLLLNTSLDDGWSDAPYQPVFVPWVHQLCYDVAGPLRQVWPDGWVGERLFAQLPPGAAGPPSVRGPDGAAVRAEGLGGRWAVTPALPGIHTASWQGSDGPHTARLAVNVSPAESDPARVAPQVLRSRLRSPAAQVVPVAGLDAALDHWLQGRADLRAPLAWLVFLLLIAETLLSGRPAPRPERQADL
jgi:hypothetical protein